MRISSVFLSLFALLLLFAQQQAAVHVYVHAADWLQKPIDGVAACHPDACEQCAVLADLHSAVVPTAMTLQTHLGTFEQSPKPLLSIFVVRLPPYQSQAPPFYA